MKKLFAILILFSIVLNLNAQTALDAEFKGIVKKFGTTYDKMFKQLQKQESKNTTVTTFTLLKGRKAVKVSTKHSTFDENKFYIFSRGRFLDGFQIVTAYREHYTLIKQSLQYSCETDGTFKEQRINKDREYNPLCPTSSMHSFKNLQKNYFVTLGALHVPTADDLFSIAIYRGNREAL